MVCSKEALHQLVQSLPGFGKANALSMTAVHDIMLPGMHMQHAMLQESAQQD